MALITLNSHTIHEKSIAYLPATIYKTGYKVFEGVLGILPVVIGIGVYMSVSFSNNFRF